jgi:hypothetical protein
MAETDKKLSKKLKKQSEDNEGYAVIVPALYNPNNFFALTTALAGLTGLILTVICFIEAVQTFFIFPYGLFVGYAVVAGLIELLFIFTGVYFLWRYKMPANSSLERPTATHIVNIAIAPVYSLIVYVANVWALSTWCTNFSNGYTSGIKGGDPNPANAASNANPRIPVGDLTALISWNFNMLLMVITNLFLSYLCLRAIFAHHHPEGVQKKYKRITAST